MSYLCLHADMLSNRQTLMSKELLLSNRFGGYYNTTAVQCNTRKYHGLLVVPQLQIDDDNHVLLSCMNETLVDHHKSVGLHTMLFPDKVVVPDLCADIEKLDVSPIIQYVYRFENIQLQKDIFLVPNQSQLLVRYQVLNSPGPITLQLRPFFAFRNVHRLSRYSDGIQPRVENVQNGVCVQMYSNYSNVYMQSSLNPIFYYAPDWWYRVYYPEEEKRGYDCYEDLFTPGQLEYSLKNGDILFVSAALDPVDPSLIHNRFTKECLHIPEVTSTESALLAASEQFIVRKDEQRVYIKAGFPWFGNWGRDTFIALPGLTIHQPEVCRQVIDTLIPYLHNGLFPNMESNAESSYNGADTSLWFFWTLQQYTEMTKTHHLIWEVYGPVCKQILDSYKNGTLFNIHANKDGLIWQGEKGKALTWMDAVVDGKPVTQREGYAVEINALWYNAIMFSLEMATWINDEKFIEEWIDLADHFPDHFVDMFWDKDHGYLADCVHENDKDFSVRPNMIFAVSLPYSPIGKKIRQLVVEKVKYELLTPRGLRSLSPNEAQYHGYYEGGQRERDEAYHQGTAWMWLLGHFAEAYLKVYEADGKDFIKELYQNIAPALKDICIGSLSEISDGNPPYESKGAIAQAWSVAEVLRMEALLKKY